MSVPTKNFNIVRGRGLRITALDECCNIYAGSPPACEVAVSNGLISVALSAEVEDGEDIRDRNWAGELCVVDRSPDEFVRWMVDFTFCGVEPSVVGLLTGLPLELDDEGTVVGIRSRSGPIDTRFAAEMWSGTTPKDCGPEAVVTYGYTLLPCLIGGTLGDLTIENGRADFTVEGAYTIGGAGWGVGPYDVVDNAGTPSPLAVAMQDDEHHLLRTTIIAPPAASADCMTLEEAGGTRPV